MSRRKKWETRGKKKTRRSREDHEPMTKNATPFWERFGSVKNGHSIPLFFLEVRILICDMTHISGRKVSTFFYYFNLCCGVLHRYPVGALHVNHIPELFRLGETLLALPPNHTHSLSLTESFSGHLAASFLLLLGGLGMIFYKWGLSGNLSTLLFF